MTWPHNAEKVFKILANSRGDEEGWVRMNTQLKEVGLTHAGDIKFAFQWLSDRERRWVESRPDESAMELSVWGPNKRIMDLENTVILARITEPGRQELLKRKLLENKPSLVAKLGLGVAILSMLVHLATFLYGRGYLAPKGQTSQQSQEAAANSEVENRRTPAISTNGATDDTTGIGENDTLGAYTSEATVEK